MKLNIIKLFISFFLLFCHIKGSEQNNITIINNLVRNIITENLMIDQIVDNDSIAVIFSGSDTKVNQYILTNIGNILLERSLKVFRNFIPDSAFHLFILEIHNFSASVNYSKPYSKKWLGENYVSRNIEVNIEIMIYSNQSKQIFKSGIETEKFKDEIKYNEIDKMEKSSYTFTIGKRAEYSLWQRIIEPALIVSSCATIIYLFFTQRI